MTLRTVYWPGWATIRCIGRGNYGTVYTIQRTVDGQAEKGVMKLLSFPPYESEIQMLLGYGYDQQEAIDYYTKYLNELLENYGRLQTVMDCPHLVKCHELRYDPQKGDIGWDIYIRMERLTLFQDAYPQDVSQELVFKAGKQLCQALIASHSVSVIHRDINPTCIFVDDNGNFKLGDYCFATIMNDLLKGLKLGTPLYHSPEVYHNKPYDIRTDIYSLGLVLYWMLNERRRPFVSIGASFINRSLATHRRLEGSPLPPPSNGCAALQNVVLKALAYDPAERYATPAEMLAALEAAEKEASQ